ncbi:tetratricopeptide repeat protein [Bacteroides stercorirosoris]|jgi:tetratricopeptide (TPR) repeat protein|uniref:TPR repeat-containing protein n=1 Tax=Bacteroides stercorirosoris TaxID=871324 RepID=A0A1M6IPU3_9BACE|nr:serine protease [Bacteroides stercorirosoris]OKZ13595.1 MAG: serine protease [Bacteroides oleiciplenus]RGX75624.1 tetratricopeptide repeat protein [Bacteroides stercorirosoris]SHJ36462.1 TPR repeat-containing protein [Bacteroides stercorirosoris]
MKKNLLLTLVLCLLAQWSVAQAPKWVEKAKRAVFSVVTYDENDKILNTGNGFFVTEDGIALSDYGLFKGAQRAVVINSEGTQMPVDVILGANDMYDVVKFRVAISGKKVPALVVSATAPAVGASVYLLPYSTQKDRSYTAGQVKEDSKIEGNFHYYTLDMRLKDKMVSCPVMTADGQVFGLAQKSSGKDTATICYAVGADYVMEQKIKPLSFNDHTLSSIGIKKGLPDTEEQALVFLYMASSQLTPEKYAELLNDFIAQYPNSADGYLRRANNQMFLSKEAASMDKVAADMDKALEVTQKKDDAYFNRAKLIYNYRLTNPETVYKDWTYDKALEEVRKAMAVEELPIYIQLEGDIQFAKKDYAAALASYEKVNTTNLVSPATYFSAAKTKELMEAAPEEILALMDSCIARCVQPFTEENAPYLLERAQMRMNAGQARGAMLDYDEYYKAVRGNVNDVFYYYREQASFQAKQFQRALDDIAKAIELNPKELTYRSELAVVNIRVGRHEEAINVLKGALEIDPDYAEAYRLIGVAQLQLKRNKEACASFAKAKELGDPNVDALIEKHCK